MQEPITDEWRTFYTGFALISNELTGAECIQEIIKVSELLSSMDLDMKNIGTSTEETFAAISDMNNDLSGYRV